MPKPQYYRPTHMQVAQPIRDAIQQEAWRVLQLGPISRLVGEVGVTLSYMRTKRFTRIHGGNLFAIWARKKKGLMPIADPRDAITLFVQAIASDERLMQTLRAHDERLRVEESLALENHAETPEWRALALCVVRSVYSMLCRPHANMANGTEYVHFLWHWAKMFECGLVRRLLSWGASEYATRMARVAKSGRK